MVKLLEGPKATARKKGSKALISWIGTGAATGGLVFLGLPTLAIIGGIAGGVLSGLLTWGWLKYRGKWGLRF